MAKKKSTKKSELNKHRKLGQIAMSVSPKDRLLEYLRRLHEVTLQEEVLFPLLRAMNFRNVEHVHGPLERGKDLKFNFTDSFGGSLLGVCQVKNEPFTGNAQGTPNVTGLAVQLKQCKMTQLLNPDNGRLQTPDSVWLVTTYPLPDKDTIGMPALFDELAAHSVRVVWPDDLVNLISSKLPLLYDRHAAHGQFIGHRLLEYLDQHHEARAFESSLTRRMTQFFVNIVAIPRGSLLKKLKRKKLAILDPPNQQTISRDEFHEIIESTKILGPNVASDGLLTYIDPKCDTDDAPQTEGTPKAKTSHVTVTNVNLLALLKSVAVRIAEIEGVEDASSKVAAQMDATRLLCSPLR